MSHHFCVDDEFSLSELVENGLLIESEIQTSKKLTTNHKRLFMKLSCCFVYFDHYVVHLSVGYVSLFLFRSTRNIHAFSLFLLCHIYYICLPNYTIIVIVLCKLLLFFSLWQKFWNRIFFLVLTTSPKNFSYCTKSWKWISSLELSLLFKTRILTRTLYCLVRLSHSNTFSFFHTSFKFWLSPWGTQAVTISLYTNSLLLLLFQLSKTLFFLMAFHSNLEVVFWLLLLLLREWFIDFIVYAFNKNNNLINCLCAEIWY